MVVLNEMNQTEKSTNEVSMLQLLGIIIIANSFIISAWWLFNGKPWGIGLGTLLILALVVGLAFIFNERAIEISFGKVATLKAAAAQAQSDAKEIAKIKERVEAQAATMDLVAKESAEAKKLLADLSEQNKIAEEKLKALTEKTAQIHQLPDGRSMFGNYISGQPSTLLSECNLMLELYRKKEFEKAFESASKAIELYESSELALRNVGAAIVTGGNITEESVATLYSVGSELAQRREKHETALKWARKAVSTVATPQRRALLVTTLLNFNGQEEAQKIMADAQKSDSADDKKLIEVLLEFGVLKKIADKP